MIEFAFEHDKDYQNIQFMFLEAIETMDHNNIVVILMNIEYGLNYIKIY